MNALSGRRYVISAIFIVVGIIYLMRLFYIQVLNDSYKMSANNNVLRYMTEYPARGLVYDREGVLLVYNEAAYDLMVTPRQVKQIDTVDFCETVGITKVQFIKKMKQVKAYSPYKESIFGCTELQSMARDLIKLNPRSTQAHFILSACYDSTGDLLSAIKYINQSLEFDPNNTSVLLNLAIVQLKLGELDASQKTLDKVSEINPFTENLRVIQSELNSRKTQ